MIRLEIDGQPVALREDSAFDFYCYNPLLDAKNSRGEFTYDIDVDLHNPNNAKLYRNINRINSITGITGRSACFFINGLVFVRGDEVLLECNDKMAKIQIVSNTHMYEHVFIDTIRISELDLGRLPEYTQQSALETLNAEPLSVPAVCTPVLVKWPSPDNYSLYHWVENDDKYTFDSRDMYNFASVLGIFSEKGSYRSGTKLVGQPYLVIVVEKVLTALGWRINRNVLRDIEFAKRMIVIHGYDTREINKMIPNWTVSEFFEQIQRLFNVVFLCNEIDKTVTIVSAGSFYAYEAPVVHIEQEDVVKADNKPARKFEGLDALACEYNGLKYNLPDEDYGRRADITEEVHKITSLIEISDLSVINTLDSPYRNKDFYNKPHFIYHQPTNTKWMLAKSRDDMGDMTIPYRFTRVDHFAHVNSTAEDEKLTELKIVPADTFVMSIQQIDENENVHFAAGVVVPFTRSIGNVNIDYSTTEKSGLNEWVGGTIPQAVDTQSENLYVAQYLGRTSTLYDHSLDVYSDYRKAKYPQVFTHRYIDGFINYRWYNSDWRGHWQQTALDALWDKPGLEKDITFDLHARFETTYAKQLPFDNKEIHTIAFRFPGARLDVNSVFIIAGRRFACVSLQYRINNGKLSPYVIGTFLPLK